MNVLFEDINAIYAGKQVKKEKYTFYEYIWMKRTGCQRSQAEK